MTLLKEHKAESFFLFNFLYFLPCLFLLLENPQNNVYTLSVTMLNKTNLTEIAM